MAYYRDVSGQSDQFLGIFGEYDFSITDGECSLFCPECRNMMTCAVYSDCVDEWESFYT